LDRLALSGEVIVRQDQPDWLADWCAIHVDGASVQQLASALQTEVRGNLAPHTDRLFQGYAPGAAFGTRNPSLDLHAVRVRYRDCLQATVDQLAAYIDASSVLVAAATEIAFRYRTVDELAAACVQDVDAVLSQAMAFQQAPDFGHYVTGADQSGPA
jgi:hypothetical protein